MDTVVVGVDCATQATKTGLARALWDGQRLRLEEARAGSRDPSPAQTVAAWVGDAESALIALDAPLGWPCALGPALAAHEAGRPLVENPDRLFHRLTDEVVEARLGKRPLEVGANLIARTAHAALAFLEAVRFHTRRPISLLWEQRPPRGVGAIEVYPAATRLARGWAVETVSLAELAQVMEGDLKILDGGTADVWDAALCLVAARDFLSGTAVPPSQLEVARREGWIWVMGTEV